MIEFDVECLRCKKLITLRVRDEQARTQGEATMATKVRINLANAQELLELAGLGPAQVAAIVRFRAEHGPIKDNAQLATIRAAIR